MNLAWKSPSVDLLSSSSFRNADNLWSIEDMLIVLRLAFLKGLSGAVLEVQEVCSCCDSRNHEELVVGSVHSTVIRVCLPFVYMPEKKSSQAALNATSAHASASLCVTSSASIHALASLCAPSSASALVPASTASTATSFKLCLHLTLLVGLNKGVPSFTPG